MFLDPAIHSPAIVRAEILRSRRLQPVEWLWILFMLLLVTSFYWWGRLDVPGSVLRIPYAIAAVPLIAFVALLTRSFMSGGRDTRAVLQSCAPPLAVMLWFTGFSILAATAPGRALAVAAEMTFYVLIFILLVSTINSRNATRKISMALVLAISGLAAEGVYKFFIEESIWRLGAGTVHTSTNMGAFMFQAAFLLVAARLALCDEESLFSKFLAGALLLLLGTALLYTYSRGSWATLVLGVFTIVWYRRALLVPLLLASLLLAPQLPVGIVTRAVSTFELDPSGKMELQRGAKISNTTELRLDNWSRTLATISENPLLGVGIGYYHGKSVEKGAAAPHNAYLRIWSEAGPIALLGFLCFLAVLARKLLKATRDSANTRWLSVGFLSIFVTHLVYMALGDWPFQIYFWVFAGLAAANAKCFAQPGERSRTRGARLCCYASKSPR